ncbi:hypothetical protein GCM10025867_16870 [Frondihabitans sucicola]|uniref:Gfo/Idh/MocA-like oxidoreductase N-terminal domain-containing protein n=1 Tax=Frondihabitans sucicola TaxID=1268041 RepID=A0ABN6XXF3_9MICO|nr:hypothetical protein GCM10025867_16870 [Frondihabitans sucicola]
MSTGPVGVGFIGAGNISTQYLDNLTKFADVKVLFIADINLAAAEAQATKYGVPGFGTVEQLLAIDEVEIVVNLTIPAAHAEVGRQVIAAGKSVWSEKPWPSRPPTPRRSSPTRRPRACARRARPTPCWAPVSSPPSARSPAA